MRVLALAWAFGCASLVLIAQQAPPAPQPVFRGGVDVVQLDVLVLDRQRRPVRGLTAADFTVRERGTPQPIVAVSEVDVPDPVEPPAAWMRDVGPDVTSNDLQTRRLIILVLDDGMTGVEVGEPRLTRQVARSVIEHLGPADLAAVVFTFSGRAQNFTADRAQLLKAIDSFAPRNWGSAGPPLGCQLRLGGCTVNALFRIGEVLRTRCTGMTSRSGRETATPRASHRRRDRPLPPRSRRRSRADCRAAICPSASRRRRSG